MATLNKLFNEEDIDRAIDALDTYLKDQRKKQQDNVLWHDEFDINVVIEPKINAVKAHNFNSIRIPLAHSFRNDAESDICIITRSKDVPKWKEVLLTTHPVGNVTKIMSLSEFERDYKTQKSRQELCQSFDLFILHPSIVYRAASKVVKFLRDANKQCAVLPMAYHLLQLGDTNNPLYNKKYKDKQLDQIKLNQYALKLAKMIAKFRDSTFMQNFNSSHKFIKIGESKMNKQELKENLINVLNYATPMIPNGGIKNVLRISIHINNTDIQIPFYYNLDALSNYYEIINPKHFNQKDEVYLSKRKQIKLKNAMKKNCPQKLKKRLIKTVPMKNLMVMKHLKVCQEEED